MLLVKVRIFEFPGRRSLKFWLICYAAQPLQLTVG